jgi:outer membrane cobalamin receptor
MNTQLRKVQVSSALALACGLFGAAHAAADSDPVALDEVVVTATRATTTLADAPAAVTIVGAKSIETKNA